MSSDEPHPAPDLTALIGSRICHDLISPIGAIGNGLELLEMSEGKTPELALIAESVGNANARIRFFRIAFGMALPDQGAPRSQIVSILKDMYGGTRLKVEWLVENDCHRREARAAFLALMCLESALPYGGDISIARNNGKWRLAGLSPKLKFDADLWAALDGHLAKITPNEVHFALLPGALAQIGRRVVMERSEAAITLDF
ncbi:MAG: histidine phosphotransferase family protein [Tropicimonas sp.]|uniref:histidine phosphotransferase family protein n=1 Tax=Tropicimonas sp. TaxID=2067044 RepID=UPI003A83FDEE